MKTTTLTLNITYKGMLSMGIEFETGQDLEDFILTFVNDEAGFNNTDDFEEVTDLSDIEYEVTDWSDVEEFENLQDIAVLNEIADCSDLEDFEWDVISAGIEADISIDNIAEAYTGQYKDDQDFAYETAISCGDMQKNPHWPYTCIDWEQAAKELMYDYSEANGYYFRNF